MLICSAVCLCVGMVVYFSRNSSLGGFDEGMYQISFAYGIGFFLYGILEYYNRG